MDEENNQEEAPKTAVAIPEMTDVPVEGGVAVATIENLPLDPPHTINSTRRSSDGRKYCAGEGKKPSRIMFLAGSVLEEELKEAQTMSYGQKIRSPARYLKGVAGLMLKDVYMSEGIDINEYYYTAYVKCLMERKPKKCDLDKFLPAFENEIAEVKPDIVVCFGKIPFDIMVGHKVSVLDVMGAWFYSEKYQCKVYVSENVDRPVKKPEFLERFQMDAREIKRMLGTTDGIKPPELPVNIRLLNKIQDVKDLVAMWEKDSRKIISVDCEWKGRNHVDGKLRYIQFAWTASDAVALQFMDQTGKHVFDASYEEVGAVLGTWLNRPEVKYVGHHISADFPWMHHVLGLEFYQKCIFDTEFGLQTVNEYEDLGLERISLKYTNRGRYDIPLLLWRKANPIDPDDGFGSIPDDILFPYSCFDVLVPMQAWPQIYAEMAKQNVLKYYNTFKLPFVADIFTTFTLMGLPIIRRKLDELRELYHWARQELEIEFRKVMIVEAKQLFMQKMIPLGVKGIVAGQEIIALVKEQEEEEAMTLLKQTVGIEHLLDYQDFFDHLAGAKDFNIRSNIHMRRWLFDVKGFTPVKSTNAKEKGLPSVAWERVLLLPPDAQKAYAPAVDKQTLQILGETGDPTIAQLLELNAVGNVCKAFLKEGSIDPETGEVLKEKGFHYWITKGTNAVHCMYSCTETSRPRAWMPNVLNIPSWVNSWITKGIGRVLELRDAESHLPEKFRRYLTEAIPSVRSTIGVEGHPEYKDWCIVESDYQTAEFI